MTHQHLIVETKGRVGVVRLNRPQALNALNTALMSELAAAIGAFEADGGIGCIVITGSDKAFAAVAGFALGGGCELAMQCDFVIAADNAQFGQPEIKLGVIPGIGGTQRLVRAVGKAKAMELCLTGRMMDATEAERSGLVARVVPAAELVEEAVKVAEKIASMSRPVAMMTKESVNRAYETVLAEGIRVERRLFHST